MQELLLSCTPFGWDHNLHIAHVGVSGMVSLQMPSTLQTTALWLGAAAATCHSACESADTPHMCDIPWVLPAVAVIILDRMQLHAHLVSPLWRDHWCIQLHCVLLRHDVVLLP